MDMPDRRRAASHRGPDKPVTVDQLIARCTSSTVPPAAPCPGDPVSVGTLLRREGRARRAADRPLLPRGHSRPAPAPATPTVAGTRIRRMTGAAGVLFTATAVLGPAVLSELTHPRPDVEVGDAAPAAPDGAATRPAGPDAVGGTGARPP
ncbi:hypothetical protein, partial [Pseudonocardia lacus]|uniref:hypothetical protein n=1 Tax=Pseudonocardia lacus TaxID=2835865 RepID=UPI001BDC1ADA